MTKPLYKLTVVKGSLDDPICVFQKEDMLLSSVYYMLNSLAHKPVTKPAEPFQTLENIPFKTQVRLGSKTWYYSVRRSF